jgi:hypothetical protein
MSNGQTASGTARVYTHDRKHWPEDAPHYVAPIEDGEEDKPKDPGVATKAKFLGEWDKVGRELADTLEAALSHHLGLEDKVRQLEESNGRLRVAFASSMKSEMRLQGEVNAANGRIVDLKKRLEDTVLAYEEEISATRAAVGRTLKREAKAYSALRDLREHLEAGESSMLKLEEDLDAKDKTIERLVKRIERKDEIAYRLRVQAKFYQDQVEGSPEIRDDLWSFVIFMEQELRRHDEERGKTGWHDMGFEPLFCMLWEHADRLHKLRPALNEAVGPTYHRDIMARCVDIANMAMMIATNIQRHIDSANASEPAVRVEAADGDD